MSFHSSVEVKHILERVQSTERNPESRQHFVVDVERFKSQSVFADEKVKSPKKLSSGGFHTPIKKEKIKLNKTAIFTVAVATLGILTLGLAIPQVSDFFFGWFGAAQAEYLKTFFTLIISIPLLAGAFMWGFDFFSDRQREKRYRKEEYEKTKRKKK